MNLKSDKRKQLIELLLRAINKWLATGKTDKLSINYTQGENIITRNVCLPMCAVKQRHGAKTLEKHEIRVISKLGGDASGKSDKHWNLKIKEIKFRVPTYIKPAASKKLTTGKSNLTSRDGITPMIKKLAKWGRRSRSSGLFSINRVQTLINEHGKCVHQARPSWCLKWETVIICN